MPSLLMIFLLYTGMKFLLTDFCKFRNPTDLLSCSSRLISHFIFSNLLFAVMGIHIQVGIKSQVCKSYFLQASISHIHHLGNILLCRTQDGSPQLGLIDYGQVKTLSKEKRHLFARIVIALDDDNRDQIITLMKEAGFRSQRMDPEVIYLYAKVGYDQDNKELTGGKHIQMFMEDLERRDPIISLPYDFIMVGRATLMLRGLGHALHQSRSVAKAWRPIAERVLREDI